MNTIVRSAVLAVVVSGSALASNFSVSGPGGSIPDVSGTNTWNVTYSGVPFTSTVTVPNPVTSITKVSLAGFNHTWRGDLHILLKDPSNTIYNVVVRPGSTGASVGDSGDYVTGTYDFVDAGGGTVAQGATNINGGIYNIFLNTGTGQWTVGGAVNGPLSAITGAAGTWTLEIRDWAAGDVGSLTGWTLEGTDAGAIPSVFCDPATGTTIACPCSNPPSGSGRGCDNSSATGGASLAASGNSSLSGDTLLMSLAGLPANDLTVLVQGPSASTSGVAFGQGVRCVSGHLLRLYTRNSDAAGNLALPGAGDPTISAQSSALGDPIAAGSPRFYMAYYRDPTVLGSCAANLTFNAANAVGVTWN